MTPPTKTTDEPESAEPIGEQAEPAEPLETGDVTEAGDPPVEPPADPDEPEASTDTRCEAETTVGGNLYRCALEADHHGEHAFQPIQGDDPDEPEPPPSPPTREAVVNEQAKKLDRATDTYTKKVVEVLGGDLSGFETCPLCEPFYPGLRLPVPLTAEIAAQLRVLLGMPAMDNFRQDRHARECDDCGGLGKVLTGSHVEQYATIQCLACHGKGWVPVGDERRLTSVQSPPQPDFERDEPDEPAPDVDPWGRPKGDPDYGRLPTYVG